MRSLAGLFGLKYAQEQRKDKMMVRSPVVEDRTEGARKYRWTHRSEYNSIAPVDERAGDIWPSFPGLGS